MTNILIVEDEAIIAEDLRETLLSLGYEVAGVTGAGAEAIRLAAELQPDLVLMDIYLQEGPDGVQAAEAIIAAQRLPIVFLTAHADSQTFVRAKAVNPAAYLYKPFDRLTLQTTLEIALERHRLEQRLAMSENRYRLLFDMAKDAVFLVEQQGRRILDCNPAAPSLYGYSRRELIGMRAEELSHEPEKTTGAIQDGNLSIPLRWHRKHDGTVFPVSINSCAFELEGQMVVISSVRDISDRVRAESELRAKETFLATIIESAPECITLHGPDGELLSMNRAGLAMLEADSLAQVKICLSDLILPEYREPFRRVVAATFQGQSPTLEFEVSTLSGRRLWMETHAVPLRDGEGRIVASLKITRDITEKKRAVEERIKTQKLESLGVMAGGIAHDFNNLLTGILGGVSMSRSLLPKDSGLDGILQIAEESCNRAKELSFRLLTFARGGDPIRKPIALGRVITGATALALSGSQVAARYELSPDLLSVMADEGQLLQVFGNIALNAREALGAEGGDYLVRAWNLPGEAGADPRVRITCADNGPGIPAGIIHQVFDPYFSTKAMGATKGQGLGLTICHSIVSKHGGAIRAESPPGQGATLIVDLPALAPAPAAVKPPAGQRALLMDDDLTFRQIVTGMLSHCGYQVTAVAKGEEAVAAVREAQAAGLAFAVAILDLTVPGGRGGLETVKELTRLQPGLPCVIASGYVNNPVLADFAQHGFAGAIAKPFGLEQLKALLADLGLAAA